MGGFPSTLAAVLVLLFAVAPGFAYRKVLRRLVIQDERSAVAEVVELFAVGALTTSTAAVVVFATGEFVDGLLSLREAVTPAHVLAHPWQVLVATAAVLLTSTLLSAAWGWLTGRRSRFRVSGVHEATTWTRTLSRRHGGCSPYLAVELSDGRLVEGYVMAVSADGEPDKRFLALQGPLAVSGPGTVPRERSEADFILLPGASIEVIHGRYVSRDELRKPSAE